MGGILTKRSITLIALGVLAAFMILPMLWSQTGTVVDFFTTFSGKELRFLAGAFVAIVIAVGAWGARNDTPVISRYIFYIAASVALVLSLSYLLFGGRWTSDPMMNKAFDIRNGEPQWMVYTDHDGKPKRGFEGGEALRPEDCRPANKAHAGFDYSKEGTCRSPLDGTVRMVPIDAEIFRAMKARPVSQRTTRRESVVRTDRVERRARARVEARTVPVRATARVRPAVQAVAAQPKEPIVSGCSHGYEKLSLPGCVEVQLFKNGAPHFLPRVADRTKECWRHYEPVTGTIQYNSTLDGHNASASRDIKVRFFRLNTGVELRGPDGSIYKCP